MSIKDNIRNFLRTNPVYAASLPDDLHDHYPLIESGVLDSIGTYTLIIYLEKNYKIKIDISDLNEKNFGDLTMIETFLKSKTS